MTADTALLRASAGRKVTRPPGSGLPRYSTRPVTVPWPPQPRTTGRRSRRAARPQRPARLRGAEVRSIKGAPSGWSRSPTGARGLPVVAEEVAAGGRAGRPPGRPADALAQEADAAVAQ